MTCLRHRFAIGAGLLLLAGCGGAPVPTHADPDTTKSAPPSGPNLPAPPPLPLPGQNGKSDSPVLGRVLLANKLTVVSMRHQPDGTGMAEFALAVLAGTDGGKKGCADLAAWLLTHSADATTGRTDCSSTIERLGGTLSIEPGLLSTWLTVRVPAANWEPAIESLAQALQQPLPGRSMLERLQREQLQAEAAAIAAAPLQTTAERLLLGDAGPADHLIAMQERDPSEAALFLSRNYRPDRCVLVIAVPGDPAANGMVIVKNFAAWQPAAVGDDPNAGPHGRRIANKVYWADGAATDADCGVALVVGLPDPVQKESAAQHLLINCLTMDGIGGRLERLQLEAGLGDVGWTPRYTTRGEARALVLTTRTSPSNAARLWQLANQARTSLRDLPPTDSERAYARGRAWLTIRHEEGDAATRMHSRTGWALRSVGEDQLLERLADLEQPDAIGSAVVAGFMSLPLAMIVVGGKPPADLADVVDFDVLPSEFRGAPPDATTDPLITAAGPWLDKALGAVGGREYLAQLEGLETIGTVTTEGAPEIAETVRWTTKGGLLRIRKILGAAVETRILGNEWTESCGNETLRLSPVEANWRLVEAERHPLLLLLAHVSGRMKFRLLATKTVDDREQVLLEAVTDRYERLRLQIDRESGLIRVVESWTTSPAGVPTRCVDRWDDYRSVDGLRLPYYRRTEVDDGASSRVTTYASVRPLRRQS